MIETTFLSPVGPLRLVATDDALVELNLNSRGATAKHPILDQAVNELERYFAGKLRVFETPLAMRGTPFQRSVWDQLARIPFGETRTYADLARAVRRPAAFRAVGATNGANPIAIIVPCHRVIATGGGLGGFGGGLPMKRWLLHHERKSLVRG